MKSWQKFCVVLSVVLLTACGTIPVSNDYDSKRDFSAFKTYAWITSPNKDKADPLVNNDLMEQRVRSAVKNQLARLGLTPVAEGEGADLFIAYHVGLENRTDIDSFHSNFGYYPCWHCFDPAFHRHHHHLGVAYGTDITVRHYKQGTFILDFIDPASSEMIWRGIADRRLRQFKTPEEREEYVNETVAAILAQFPPGKAANSK